MRRQFEAEDWEINQILRQRQLEHAGIPAAHIDLVNRTLTPLPDPAPEWLDPTRPTRRPDLTPVR